MTPCVGLLAPCLRMHLASVSISRLPVSAGRPAFFTTPLCGSTSETRAFLHRLAGLVAVVEGTDHLQVKARLADQLSVVLAQGAGCTLRRRRAAAGPRPLAPGLVSGLVLEPWLLQCFAWVSDVDCSAADVVLPLLSFVWVGLCLWSSEGFFFHHPRPKVFFFPSHL